MNTLVVNFVGGQGSGKSTMMANVFSWLKWNNVDCEMCTEFAKELVWENRKDTFKDELYIFAKQNHRLERCNGKVAVILTDRPLVMSIPYIDEYGESYSKEWKYNYKALVKQTASRYNNLYVMLNRVKPFNSNGRNETEEKAREFDYKFNKLLDELEVGYTIFDGHESSVNMIGSLIMQNITHNKNTNSELCDESN